MRVCQSLPCGYKCLRMLQPCISQPRSNPRAGTRPRIETAGDSKVGDSVPSFSYFGPKACSPTEAEDSSSMQWQQQNAEFYGLDIRKVAARVGDRWQHSCKHQCRFPQKTKMICCESVHPSQKKKRHMFTSRTIGQICCRIDQILYSTLLNVKIFSRGRNLTEK